MIKVQELVKRYGDNVALDHISFHIEKGKVYGFLGPNGAGKSTTMNILTGYIGATGGTVEINGHDILMEPDEARRSIGYLPELPPIYMDMVVEEYLNFCARLKKIPKKECSAAVASVLEDVAITHVKDRLIKNLSKGYKQRVGLAQALLGYPEVIILDEPTVGLDPKQIIEIRQLIRSLAGEHTVIFSSHILSEVQEVCDEVLIINKGRLVAAGTTADLERRMSSSSLVVIVKNCAPETAEAAFAGIEGVEEVTAAPSNSAPDELVVNLKVSRGMDIRSAAYAAAVKAGLELLTLKSAEVSLEDVFLELTGGEAEEKEADE